MAIAHIIEFYREQVRRANDPVVRAGAEMYVAWLEGEMDS